MVISELVFETRSKENGTDSRQGGGGPTADEGGEDGPSVGLNQRWKKGGEEINSEGGGTGPSFEQGTILNNYDMTAFWRPNLY